MGSAYDKKVDCGEALHRMYHFLDGELTADRKSKIKAHINNCEPCFEMFGFEAELRKLVACRCRDEVPQSLRARIAEAIDHEHSHLSDPSVSEACSEPTPT